MFNGLLEGLLALFPTVAFAAAFITAFVEGLKRVGWMPDGYAGIAALVLNALFWVVQYVAGDLGYGAELVTIVDALAALLPIFFGVLTSVGVFEVLRR